MANYPLPPWISPAAAQGYGELAGQASRAALSAQLQREKMSQDATQFAIESQQRAQQIAAENDARQQQLAYEHQMEQQKNAIDNAYKQQQLSLQQQENERAQQASVLAQQSGVRSQQQWDAEVTQTAKAAAADARFNKAILPKDQGGEGMDPIKAALLYKSGTMSSTELGRLSTFDRPPAIMPNAKDVPGLPGHKGLETSPGHFQIFTLPNDIMTNAPPAIPVTDKDGNVIANYAINPTTHKADLIRPSSSGTSSIDDLIKSRMKGKVSTAVDTTKERVAQSGYKIGVVYKGGLKYLGGDPTDEKSWEKVQ